jgi:hypothetical protein
MMTDQVEPLSVWLTREQLAARQQLSVITLAQWASRGYGPKVYKFGWRVRYKVADVVDWENSQVVNF